MSSMKKASLGVEEELEEMRVEERKVVAENFSRSVKLEHELCHPTSHPPHFSKDFCFVSSARRAEESGILKFLPIASCCTELINVTIP